MKKLLVVGAVLALAIVALGMAGLVYAQTQTPPTPTFPGYGPGMMGGRGGMVGGFQSGNIGPMHDYMVDAYAEALGITVEEFQDRLAGGENMWQIALSLGFSEEAIPGLMIAAHTQALNKAVDDGVLSQEQADWMIQRMAHMQAQGFGPGAGGCGGFGGRTARAGGMMQGWRWNNQP
jgi:hypothetical protein